MLCLFFYIRLDFINSPVFFEVHILNGLLKGYDLIAALTQVIKVICCILGIISFDGIGCTFSGRLI